MVIEPYNETLKDKKSTERKAWADNVLTELRKVSNLKNDEFIFLAGKVYSTDLLPHISHYQLPLKGKKLGQWIPELKRLIDIETNSENVFHHFKEQKSSINNSNETVNTKITTKNTEKQKITSEDIRKYIEKVLQEEKMLGNDYVDLVSGDIHKQLGLNNKMPSVCQSMYKIMRGNDEILNTTPSGKSSTIKIRYYIKNRT